MPDEIKLEESAPLDQIILEGTDATPPPKEEPKVDRARDERGRFSSAADDEKALDRIFKEKLGREKPVEVKPAAEQEKPAKAPVANLDKVKAMKALELDGFTEEDLDGMSDERILALGQKAQKRQADIGKKLSERPKTEAPVTDGEVAPKADTKVSAQATYKELSKSVGELLGDDVGEALSGVLEKALSPMVERLNRAEGLLQQRLEAEMETQVASLRTKLAADFPPLKDDAAMKRVVERMGELADPAKYSDLESVMRAACKLELFDDVVKAAKSTPRNDTSRNNGQPTSATRNAKPKAAMTRHEAEDSALDEIFQRHGLSR